MKNLHDRIKAIVLLLVLVGATIAGVVFKQPVLAKAGDDPGVTLSGPTVINSKGLVELNVTLAASAGKLAVDDEIEVVIPQKIVADPEQLTSMLGLEDPFYLADPAYTTDSQGNYLLHVKYDVNKIDPNEANGYTFNVQFRAPYFTDNSIVPPMVNFSTNLIQGNKVVSSDQTVSQTHPDGVGSPAFTKYSNANSLNIDGQQKYVMSPTDPGSNNFALVVNYNQQNYDNLTITDTMPKGLSLADSYSIFPSASGDSTDIQHLKIYRINWDTQGNIAGVEYVTGQFADKITSTASTFSINFGKVTSDQSYAISYGAAVDSGLNEENFGTRYNHATMSNGQNGVLYEANVPLIMHEATTGATSLRKTVDHAVLTTNSSSLLYTLKLSNNNGTLKAGTVVTDPLPAHTRYLSTTEHQGFSAGVYDAEKNTISYTLQEDIAQGDSREIKFTVQYDNSQAHVGDKVVNRAGYSYAGSTIYSNDATTLLSGSAVLQKLDRKTGNPLEGATFKIVDSDGKLVINDLKTNTQGIVNSGLLAPGKYAFIETSAPNGYAVDSTPNPFTVVDGQEAAVDLIMYNSQATELSGKKYWQDNDDAAKLRPSSITVDLYQNGLKIKQTTATATNGWQYHFTDLAKFDRNGNQYHYTVKEEPVANYAGEQTGNDFTNTLDAHPTVTPEPPLEPLNPETPNERTNSQKELPQTDLSLTSYLPLLGIGILSIIGFGALKREH